MDNVDLEEQDHLAAEAAVKFFSYRTPENFARKKTSVLLARGQLVRGMVQVVKEGGENNLHYHSNADGFWMVLQGCAKFYGPGDKLLGEISSGDGVVIPRNARYWFESSGKEQLEILLVQALADPKVTNTGRTDSEARKIEDAGTAPQFSAEI